MNVTRCVWMMIPVVLARFAFTAIAEPTESGAIDPPAGLGAMAPNLSTIDDGVVLTWLEPVIVAQTSGARTIGFPKLARSGSNVLLVWTQDAEPTRLRAVTIPIAEIPNAAGATNNEVQAVPPDSRLIVKGALLVCPTCPAKVTRDAELERSACR